MSKLNWFQAAFIEFLVAMNVLYYSFRSGSGWLLIAITILSSVFIIYLFIKVINKALEKPKSKIKKSKL